MGPINVPQLTSLTSHVLPPALRPRPVQLELNNPRDLLVVDARHTDIGWWRRCALGVVVVAQACAITHLVGLLPANSAALCLITSCPRYSIHHRLPPLQTAPPALANTQNFTIDVRPSEDEEDEDRYFQTVPQGLSSSEDIKPKGPRLGSLLEGPKGKEVQQCARKCVPTCIRGGQGAPGLGPMSVRKEVVVFKDGYRTRQYCLSECIQVCSLTLAPKAPAAAVP